MKDTTRKKIKNLVEMQNEKKRLEKSVDEENELSPFAAYGDGTTNFGFILFFIVIVTLMVISA